MCYCQFQLKEKKNEEMRKKAIISVSEDGKKVSLRVFFEGLYIFIYIYRYIFMYKQKIRFFVIFFSHFWIFIIIILGFKDLEMHTLSLEEGHTGKYIYIKYIKKFNFIKKISKYSLFFFKYIKFIH